MISVCMATYNGEKYLSQQIESILAQLDADDELVISDDGSQDLTSDIIFSYKKKDNRIKLIQHYHNKKFEKVKYSKNYLFSVENFENALRATKGDYIFLADQDDIWLKGRKTKFLNGLKNKKIVMCNYSIIDANNNVIENKHLQKNPVSKYLIKNIMKCPFTGCTMAFSKDVLKVILPFPYKLISHDYWIGCLFYKDVFFIDEPLHLYRRVEGNVSTTTEKSNNPLWYKIFYRIRFCYQLIFRKFTVKFGLV